MGFEDEFESGDLLSISRVAKLLGMTVNNLRALERRGRLPEGCEPEIDLLTGARGWTQEQVERLQTWNAGRMPRKDEESEGGEADESD